MITGSAIWCTKHKT